MRNSVGSHANKFQAARLMAALLLLADPAGRAVQAAVSEAAEKPMAAAVPAPAQAPAAAVKTAGLKSEAAPSPARLKNVAYENGQLRIRLDRSAAYKVFQLSKPSRLVVEIAQAVHEAAPYDASVNDGILKRIRAAQFQNAPSKIARVVLELDKATPYEASAQGNDIVVTFAAAGTQTAAKPAAPARRTEAAASADGAADSLPPLGSAENVLEGEADATVTATAAKPAANRAPTQRRIKDLLAALPKNPVTIDFDEADVRDVIRVLSEMANVNMIHSPDLRGVVTIHLDQVPFNEAFNTILTMYGLVAQQMGDNILRILTPEALNSDRSRAVTSYKTYTLNYAKASEVQGHLQSVRISPNGKITVDERSNSLIVTDTPEGLIAAERLIADLDKKPQQVMIEAKMVEIILSDSMDMGIQWEYSSVNNTASKTNVIGVRETSTGPDASAGGVGFIDPIGTGALNNPATVAGNTSVSSLGPGERGTGVSLPGPQNAAITFGFINNTNLLTATLTALAQKGQTKVLSSPKVITVNNKQAKIQVGSRIPFSVTTVAATGVATQSFQFVDVGIILTVTPTINADNRIRINVKPEVSFPGAVGPAGPEINTRNAETEVIIQDGETLVIGGLIDEQMRESAQKVPLLGDIPVLGTFFRSTSDSKRRSELLVFVTPRIIRE